MFKNGANAGFRSTVAAIVQLTQCFQEFLKNCACRSLLECEGAEETMLSSCSQLPTVMSMFEFAKASSRMACESLGARTIDNRVDS